MVVSELRNHLLFHFSVLSHKPGGGAFDLLINHCDRREYTERPRETFKKLLIPNNCLTLRKFLIPISNRACNLQVYFHISLQPFTQQSSRRIPNRLGQVIRDVFNHTVYTHIFNQLKFTREK